MPDEITIRCQCGEVKGQLREPAFERHNHLVCYCKDCQAFARFVGAKDTMNPRGGTDIVQVSCADVTITGGQESLACMKLTKGGLHRWYASCCNTPVGNAPGVGMPFIGLIHDCLQPVEQIDRRFGPVSFVVFKSSAIGEEKPKSLGMPLGFVRFLSLVLAAKFRGDGENHPFFTASGDPVAVPRVLDEAERSPLYPA